MSSPATDSADSPRLPVPPAGGTRASGPPGAAPAAAPGRDRGWRTGAIRWLTAATLAAAGYLAYSGFERIRLERRAEDARGERVRLRAEWIDELRFVGGLCVDAALLVRRAGGRTADAEARFRPVLSAVTARAPEDAHAPAEPHYHLGRLLRVLLRGDEAREALDRALAADPGHLAARYERIVLAGEDLARLHAARWADRHQARLLAASEPGLEATVGRDAKEPESPAADPVQLALEEGIRAHLARLKPLPDGGETAPAGPEEESEAPAGNRAPAAPGLSQARLECARGLMLAWSGDQETDADAARERFERALAVDRTLDEAYVGLAVLELRAGRVDAAIAALDRLLAVDRGLVFAWRLRSQCRRTMAEREGIDAGAAADHRRRALSDLDRVVELAPERARSWAERGAYRLECGLSPTVPGLDSRAEFRAALADFDEALRRAPEESVTWLLRARAGHAWGVAEHDGGGEAVDLVARAREDFREARRFAADGEEVRVLPAALEGFWARVRLGRGEEVQESIRAAEEAYARALEAASGDPVPRFGRGLVRALAARETARRGLDPAALFASAQEDLDLVADLRPDAVAVWLARAELELDRAQDRERRGEDPEAAYLEAERDLDRALDLRPESVDAQRSRGRVRRQLGLLRIRRGEHPGEVLGTAVEDLDRVLARRPGDAEALWLRATLCLDWAEAVRDRGEPATELLEAAVTDATAAIAADPAQARSWRARGRARLLAGENLEALAQDPAAHWAGALADLEEAARLDPADAEARSLRGRVRLRRGEWVEADEDFSAAVRLRADWESALREPWSRARARRAQVERIRGLLELAGRGDEALAAGDGQAAAGAYAAFLSALARSGSAAAPADGEPFGADPERRRRLADVHFGMARALSMQSAGRLRRDEPARALDPAVAADLRDRAFHHLREAARGRTPDGPEPAEEPDLDPLHPDPRWEDVLRDFRSPPPAGGK